MTPDHEAAFTRFVEQHATGLLRYARLLVADRHEAEDALQTVLLRVARNWGQARRAPVAYARAALRNLAIDGSRRKHLVPVPAAEDPAPLRAPDLAEAYEAAEALDSVLSVLPARQRVTVVLRVIDGLSEAETATALRCSPGTVKSNLSRGLATLREHLADHDRSERSAR